MGKFGEFLVIHQIRQIFTAPKVFLRTVSDAEELKLAEWAMDMANIGCGCTREDGEEVAR